MIKMLHRWGRGQKRLNGPDISLGLYYASKICCNVSVHVCVCAHNGPVLSTAWLQNTLGSAPKGGMDVMDGGWSDYLLGGPVWDQELDLMILMHPFQLIIFNGSMILGYSFTVSSSRCQLEGKGSRKVDWISRKRAGGNKEQARC